MKWKCLICFTLFFTLRILLRHYRDHAHSPNFIVNCNVEDCPSSYTNYPSFYQHVFRHHGHLLDVVENEVDEIADDREIVTDSTFGDNNVDVQIMECNNHNELSRNREEEESSIFWNQEYYTENEEGEGHELEDDTNIYVAEENQGINNVPEPETIQMLKVYQKEKSIPYLLNIREFHKVKEKTVDVVACSTDSFVHNTVDILRNQVSRTLLSAGIDPDAVPTLNAVFDNFQLPFTGIDSTYRRKKFIKKNYNFLEPEQVFLGQRLSQKRRLGNRRLEAVNETFMYIPIIDSIAQFIENENVQSLVLSEPEFSLPGFLCNVCDGSVYKNHNLFRRHRRALQLSLYFDDLEVCNPIGKSAGVHKIGIFYYTILNMPPQYRSRLPAIRLVSVIKRASMNRYGIGKVLVRLKQDLDQLSEGVNITVNENVIHIQGAVLLFCGDTLSANEFAGFKQGVGFAFQKCRECECTNADMQIKFNDINFIQRSLRRYDQQVHEMMSAQSIEMRRRLSTAYGINERSTARDFPYFNLTQMVPADIMHVIFEGVAVYEVKLALRCMVSDGLFSLNLLNNHIDNFPYGYKHRDSKPTKIPHTVFENEADSSNLKQSASSMMTLLAILPFILNNKLHINTDNVYVQLILELCEIVKVLLAPVISYETIQLLKTLIENHLYKFKELFPSKNILPKQHFMVHLASTIERFGPLCNIWCMRYEGKHQLIKERISGNHNCKNVEQSISERCAMYECTLNICDKHPLFTYDQVFGKVSAIELQYAKNFIHDFFGTNINCIKDVHSVSWIISDGQKFISNQCEITFGESDGLPEFGRLKQIWVSNEVLDDSLCKNVYFLLQMYETKYYDENVHSYSVELPTVAQGYELVFAQNIFLPIPLHLYQFGNDSYITVPYDLTDVIQLHRKKNIA